MAIGGLFCAGLKKSLLSIFRQNGPKFGDSERGTKTEAVTMARIEHSKKVEEDVLWGGRTGIIDKESKLR